MKAKLLDSYDGYTRRRFYRLSEPVRMGYTDVDNVFDAVERARTADILQYRREYDLYGFGEQYVRECKDILTNGITLVCIEGPNEFKKQEKYLMAAMRFWGWYDGKRVPDYYCLPYMTLVYSYNRKSKITVFDNTTAHDDIYLELLAKANGLQWEGIMK